MASQDSNPELPDSQMQPASVQRRTRQRPDGECPSWSCRKEKQNKVNTCPEVCRGSFFCPRVTGSELRSPAGELWLCDSVNLKSLRDGAKAREVAAAWMLSRHGAQAPGSVWGPRGGAPDLVGSPAVGAMSMCLLAWESGLGQQGLCLHWSWVCGCSRAG